MPLIHYTSHFITVVLGGAGVEVLLVDKRDIACAVTVLSYNPISQKFVK